VASKRSLADELAEAPYTASRRRAWWEYMDPETMADLNQLRRNFRAGKYGPRTARSVWHFVSERVEIPVGERAFMNWLTEMPMPADDGGP